MAFNLSADAQLVFFNKVFGQNHPVVEKVKGLLAGGVTFEVSLYSLRAFVGKKALEPVQLTYGTTALMKGTVEAAVYAQNKKLIEDWVAYLYVKQGNPVAQPKAPKLVTLWLNGVQDAEASKLPLIKAVHKLVSPPISLGQAKSVVDTAAMNIPVKLGDFQQDTASVIVQTLVKAGGVVGTDNSAPNLTQTMGFSSLPKGTTPEPVPTVIHLKDANALGQKVHGTSTGSVYHCIAVGEHVRVAARLSKGGSVSIRAEWPVGQPEAVKAELKKLEEAGVQMKGHYGSIHFDAADVPLSRVIGAFLLGTGIQWKNVVTSGADLIVGEK